ncbi:sigma-70 family RNA polymerase sigma factor [Leptolyngbya sp. FACHB-261]|uniref:sigma-70 family RNA polymerase sigma factor n=1 Tax=Leptolyngbya sp. FACHB-261 TaxID=2692806 RepID=UPI001685A573|nr:sigma-70 family RNA polymerase sigma factor [Leptolyngbya sp. FACHB-261]MBD2102682.1 sigma-70 family RNA polymerase sigma factor [Leptolyngbya sp. FACHB-261]
MKSEHSGNPAIPLASQTDAELFLALKNGQTAALGIIYDRHAGLVYGIALNALGNSQEAEDLTQDIFLTFTRGASYDPKRGSLRTFLAILTRSRAIDRLRSRNSAREVLKRWRRSEEYDATPNAPLEHAFQNEQSQEVSTALAQLSDSQQQILKMAYYEGLSQSEIAERLAIPLGTVKARARRGLLKLRQTLARFTG